MNVTDKFYDAWWWLYDHPYYYDPSCKGLQFSLFRQSLQIDIVKVNPETNQTDSDGFLNTKPQVWLETGSFIIDNMMSEKGESTSTHDWRLDVEADSFEEAIIKLKSEVFKYVGDYDKNVSKEELLSWKEMPWKEPGQRATGRNCKENK